MFTLASTCQVQCRQMRTEYVNMCFELRLTPTGVKHPEVSTALFTKLDAYVPKHTHTPVQSRKLTGSTDKGKLDPTKGGAIKPRAQFHWDH